VEEVYRKIHTQEPTAVGVNVMTGIQRGWHERRAGKNTIKWFAQHKWLNTVCISVQYPQTLLAQTLLAQTILVLTLLVLLISVLNRPNKLAGRLSSSAVTSFAPAARVPVDNIPDAMPVFKTSASFLLSSHIRPGEKTAPNKLGTFYRRPGYRWRREKSTDLALGLEV
jgi:hypothetical protein